MAILQDVAPIMIIRRIHERLATITRFDTVLSDFRINSANGNN